MLDVQVAFKVILGRFRFRIHLDANYNTSPPCSNILNNSYDIFNIDHLIRIF